jgi:hypothetical protein
MQNHFFGVSLTGYPQKNFHRATQQRLFSHQKYWGLPFFWGYVGTAFWGYLWADTPKILRRGVTSGL